MTTHPASTRTPPPKPRSRLVAVLGNALGALSILGLLTAALPWGLSLQPRTMITYFEPGSAGAPVVQALDLSSPIFVTGKLCPGGGLLALYAGANAQGCLMANGRTPVTVLATAMNGRHDRVFEVDMATAEGTAEAWVRSGNLRN